jgi:hypothetical protein
MCTINVIVIKNIQKNTVVIDGAPKKIIIIDATGCITCNSKKKTFGRILFRLTAPPKRL